MSFADRILERVMCFLENFSFIYCSLWLQGPRVEGDLLCGRSGQYGGQKTANPKPTHSVGDQQQQWGKSGSVVSHHITTHSGGFTQIFCVHKVCLM